MFKGKGNNILALCTSPYLAGSLHHDRHRPLAIMCRRRTSDSYLPGPTVQGGLGIANCSGLKSMG
jgi:hypothetical protein